MNMNTRARMAEIRLLEKMKADPAYAGELTLVNKSKFCGTAAVNFSVKTMKSGRERMNEKAVKSIACSGHDDFTDRL